MAHAIDVGFEPIPHRAPAPIELSVLLPTFNEAENVQPMLARLRETLRGVAYEVIFIDDDSKDGTAEAVSAAAREHANVRLVRRIGRRGLSSAVVEGALSSTAPFLAVMDADMQHDERMLPAMLGMLRAEECDLVIGSRYVAGGGVGEWSADRARMSRLATRLARLVARADLTDPMSGFFMMTRAAFEGSVRRLSGQGFKILLDILASAETPLAVREVPYVFRPRRFGESKLDSAVVIEYGTLLLDKTIGRYVPARFLMFAGVGGLGLLVHMLVLSLNLFAFGLGDDFLVAQSIATVAAMTFNFFVNNALTYRDRRLKGFWNTVRGLLSFYAACSLGAIANVGIAGYMFNAEYNWAISAVLGVLVGAVWNYAVTAVFTWRAK